MKYRERFVRLIDQVRACPGLVLEKATLEPPTPPGEIARACAMAGAAWPRGMTALYTELGGVDIRFRSARTRIVKHPGGSEDHFDSEPSGSIRIPPVGTIWDVAELEDVLWFDHNPVDHPLRKLRPIDWFGPEGCAVLHVDGPDAEPLVHYHYCGEILIPTGLSYFDWLEALFVSRGVSYWILAHTGPLASLDPSFVKHFTEMAKLFPDYDPAKSSPPTGRPEINVLD